MKKILFFSLILLSLIITTCAKIQPEFNATYSSNVISTDKTTASISMSISSTESIDAQGMIYTIDTTNFEVSSYFYNYSYSYTGDEGGKLVTVD